MKLTKFCDEYIKNIVFHYIDEFEEDLTSPTWYRNGGKLLALLIAVDRSDYQHIKAPWPYDCSNMKPDRDPIRSNLQKILNVTSKIGENRGQILHDNY